MESQPYHRAVHVCRCPDCQRGRRSAIIKEHRAINQLVAILDEKWRRLFAGFWATVYGRGGVARLARVRSRQCQGFRRNLSVPVLEHALSSSAEGCALGSGGGFSRGPALSHRTASSPEGPPPGPG